MSDLEFDRVERTSSTAKTDKFAEAVCAFANDFPKHNLPGYLLVGADDQGKPTGLTVTDDILNNLAALRSDGNIQPIPALAVAKFTLDRGDIAVVEVQPADLPPVRYKGKVWIRIGPRRGTATEQQERILIDRRISFARSFDALPCRQATLDDLDAARFLVGYDNHIEIANPGGLYGDATPEHFPFRNDYRNPVVASALFALGYVNRYGQGILRAQKALIDNGNPLPKFNFDPHWFSVRIDKILRF